MKKKKAVKIKFIENAKIKNVLSKILYVVITICILYNIIYLINTTITKKEYISIFGISFFNMKSSAMKPELSKNDFIIVKEDKNKALETGDIIAYRVNGNIKINKIFYIQIDDGKIAYVTKSNQNYYPDNEKIKKEQIIGTVVVHVPILGFFTNILESKITSLIVILILVLKFSYNKEIYKRKRQRKRKKGWFESSFFRLIIIQIFFI